MPWSPLHRTLTMANRLLVVLLAGVYLANGYLCPPGWVQWEDNCYYVSLRSNQLKDWNQAHDICKQMQGDLLYIESQQEYKWLTDILNEITLEEIVSQQWWTGLNDQQAANSWVWSSNGNKMNIETEIPWASGYPRAHTDQECEHTSCNRCALVTTLMDFIPLKRKNSAMKGLVQQRCGVKNPFICKRVNITDTPSLCDYGDGWHQIGSSCWKLFDAQKMNWYDSRDHCQNVQNGRLASVHTDQDHKSLLSITTEKFHKYWIGLQANMTGATMEGVWTDGSELSHDIQETYWAPGEPNFNRLRRGCVYMDDSKSNDEGWHLDSCYEDMSFVCQRPQGVCPPNWATYNGRCYEFNQQNKKGWTDAKKYCEAQNTTLIVVDSEDEKRFLTYSKFLSRLGISAIWLGFEKYLNNYVWINGARVNTTDLEIPDNINTGNKICGLLITDGDGNMTVTDNCAQAYPFICEAAAVDTVIDYKHPPVDTFCDIDHFQYKGNCYKMYSDKVAWFDAQKACSTAGSKLVSISNSQEQAFLNTHTSQVYWVGLSSYGKTMKWRWQDASDVNYRNFRVGYTKSLLPNANNCVTMSGRAGRYKGQWSPLGCNEKMPYICEKAGSKMPITTTPVPDVDPDCGMGWVSPHVYTQSDITLDSCYQLNKENRVWSEAQADCRNKGGDLASILSPYEQTTVENYIPRDLAGASVWVGGSDQTTNSAWGWSDGKPFSYMNWDGILQRPEKLSRCIGMKMIGKTWVAEPCAVKQPYMCKKLKLGATIAPATLPPMTTLVPGMAKACPDTYDMIGDSCYKFYNKTATQIEATDICKGDGAFLASAESELEDINEIHAGWVFKGHRNTPLWWIGLEDKDGDGTFTWQDGSPVTFVDWGEHQPTEIKTRERCVLMTHTKATWDVRDCHDEADGFICKTQPTITKAKTPTIKITDVCPPMATHMTDSTCYLRAYSLFNWDTARQSCATNNMELAMIDTAEEAAEMVSVYRKSGARNVWLNYKNFNGTYLNKGLSVDMKSFMPQFNKDHTGNEFGKCVYISAYSGLLYDSDCSERRAFTCKVVRTDYQPTVAPPVDTACPNDWTRAGEKCYKAFQDYDRSKKKSWFDARDHCRALGGDLLSLHAQNIDDASLTAMFRDDTDTVQDSEYWIGLHLLDRTKGYRWTDKSNFDLSLWEAGEPNNLRLLEPCVVANVEQKWVNGKKQPISISWNDKYCAGHHDYVCQIPTGSISGTLAPTTTLPTPKAIPGVQGKCEPGWLEFTTNCYKFKRDYFNWHEAKVDCEKENGHLVVIHSKEQNDFIYSQITRRNEMHWSIGLTQYDDDQWGWVDDTPFDFVAWLENEPSAHGGFEKCAEIWHHAGFWNDYNCGMKHRGHICQRPVNGVTLPPRTTEAPGVGNCREGFERIDNKCFQVLGAGNPLNWTNAQTVCRMMGTGFDLASVDNAEQQAFIAYLTRDYNTSVWIGFADLLGKYRFLWSNSGPVGETFWVRNQPGGKNVSAAFASYLVHNLNTSAWIGFADLLGFRRFVWSNSDSIMETYWAEGEPSWSNTPRCTRLETDDRNSLARWKPDTCDRKLPYICSGPLDKSIITPFTTPTSKICTNGFQEYDGRCYKLFMDFKNFNDAADTCYRNGNSYLASVLSGSEQVYLQVLMARESNLHSWADVWIGMKRTEYQVNQLTVGQYEWQDRWDVTYSNWGEGQPRHIEKQPNCVTINSTTGDWRSIHCEAMKPFICKSTTEELPTRAPHRYLCENPNSISYRDKCYTVHTPKYGKSWHQASSQCVMEGMRLASIHDGDVQDFLTNLIGYSENPSQVWVGLIKNKRGAWIWSDGSESEYEQWGPGQPSDSHKNQNDICGFLKYDDNLSINYGANWTSDRCYASKGWICQEDGHYLTTPTPPSTIPTTTEKQFCHGDKDWKYYNDNCYYRGNEKISWHDADAKCKSMSSELASLHGLDEIEAVFDGAYFSFYIAAIGLTKLGRSNWEWTDRSFVDFSNWWDGEPNNHDRSERCAFMFTHTRTGLYAEGRWNDQHCGTQGGYICKRPEVPKPVSLSPAIMIFRPGHCPAGGDWVEYGNRCYNLVTGSPKNWTDARDDCRTMGPHADLVTVRNVKEQSFISSQLYKLDENIWIGLNDRFWNRHFWWGNNHPVTFTNWLEGEPDVNDGDCAEMLLHRRQPGKWRIGNCSFAQNYMCVMDKDTKLVTPAPTPRSDICQPGYTEYDKACYKLYTSKVSWNDAENECANENAALVSIRNAYEQAFVESMLVYENDPVWTGMIEVEAQMRVNVTADIFIWDDGFPVTYTQWDDSRPIPAENNEMKCVTMNPLTGKWNDTFCYYSHAFVCKQTQEVPTTPPPASYKCADDEMLYGDKCFQHGDGRDSWSDAHLSCMQKGMELASFHSFDETMYVLDRIFEKNEKGHNLWIGMVKNKGVGFYWLDKSPLDWTYWERNEPNDKYDNEACVEMVYSNNGRWNDLSCNSWLDYICERPADIVRTTPTRSTRNPRTPSRSRPSTTSQPLWPWTTRRVPVTLRPVTRGPYRPRKTPARLDQSTISTVVKGDQSPLIAGIVVAMLIIVGVLAAFAFLIYQRKKKSDSENFRQWSGAHFKPGDGDESGDAAADGSLRFTNSLYDKEGANGNGNRLELQEPNQPTTTPGISVP